MIRALLAVALAATTACASVGVPGPVSPAPSAPAHPTVYAGFGKADITPPPGAGLFGYGPEGKVSRGHRHRLYARALVIEDPNGERLALVTADLGAISELVQRRAAEITRSVGIGADRLVIAATHTHSAPGHYFALAFDHFGTERFGFDSRMVELLSSRIAEAVTTAAAGMRPAKLAWAVEPVWGLTRNRDLPAFRMNQPAPRRFTPPAGLPPEKAAINPSWTLLRVDLLDRRTGSYRPAGAFSIFAIHGTGNPSANDLYDGDIHSIVERSLEKHIDSLNGVANDSTTIATHLFANGTEGDISPDWPPASRCPVPTLAIDIDFDRPIDYLKLRRTDAWKPPDPVEVRQCIAAARAYVDSAGDTLGARAIAIFESLKPADTLATVARVFDTIELHNRRSGGICPRAEVGTATTSGVADGVTRYRVAGLPFVEEGGAAVDYERFDCHWPKNTVIKGIQELLTELIVRLPRRAQFTVARIGPMVLATVPGEVTTTVGRRIRATVRAALASSGTPTDSVSVLGVANGYLYYITTPEEYALQHYAGSSTIYGPNTASLIATILASMAGRLPARGRPSPPADVNRYRLRTGTEFFRLLSGDSRVIPEADQGPDVIEPGAEITCGPELLTVHWRDVYPGRLYRMPYPLIAIQELENGTWVNRVWDDDRHLEMRADSADGDRGFWYSVRWSPAQRPSPGTRLRARLPATAAVPPSSVECTWSSP